MKNYTDITIILDSSGSMASVLQDTIGGFNTFLQEQRKVTTSRISLVQFNDRETPIYTNRDINEAEELSIKNFIPSGNTALLDAMQKTIAEIGKRLSSMKEEDRPERVVIVTITDGHENASKECTKAKLLEIIKHQEQAYKWQFVYLGSNQNAIAEATAIGISAANSMTFSNTAQGIHEGYAATASNVSKYASGATMDCSFEADDRKKQNELLKKYGN